MCPEEFGPPSSLRLLTALQAAGPLQEVTPSSLRHPGAEMITATPTQPATASAPVGLRPRQHEELVDQEPSDRFEASKSHAVSSLLVAMALSDSLHQTHCS